MTYPATRVFSGSAHQRVSRDATRADRRKKTDRATTVAYRHHLTHGESPDCPVPRQHLPLCVGDTAALFGPLRPTGLPREHASQKDASSTMGPRRLHPKSRLLPKDRLRPKERGVGAKISNYQRTCPPRPVVQREEHIK